MPGISYQRPQLIAMDPPDPSRGVSSYSSIRPLISTSHGKPGVDITSSSRIIPRKMPHTGGGGAQRPFTPASSWWIAAFLLLSLLRHELRDQRPQPPTG